MVERTGPRQRARCAARSCGFKDSGALANASICVQIPRARSHPICEAGLAVDRGQSTTFLLEFSEMHRVGDQGSEDTRFGNCRSVFRVYFMLLDISYLRVGFFLGGGLGRADRGFFFSSILDSFFVCDELKPSC